MRRVLDLFCGAVGGWSAGVERAGWRTVAACEIDPWRRAVFGAQHPNAILYADVRDVTAARLRADLGYLPDAVVGSPPCQDISAANSRGLGIGGARSGLFWEWLRIIDEVRPGWACAENSPRFRTLGYDDIASGLEAIGYACWPLVVGADDIQAPHRRKRVWVVAADADGQLAGRAGRDANGRLFMGKGTHDDALADAHGSGHPLGPSLPGDDGPQLPAALRDIGRAWPDWNGGLPGLTAACAAAGAGPLDDGLVAGLSPGLRNRAIAALGDAVLPQITEAIARSIDAIEDEIRMTRAAA